MKTKGPRKAIGQLSEDQFILLCRHVGGDFHCAHYKLHEARKSLDGLRKDVRFKFDLWSVFKEEIRRRIKARTVRDEAAVKSLLNWGHDFQERF